MKLPQTVAFIPARGGSKSIIRKNMSPLNGRPLIDFTLDAAFHSNIFEQIVVSTDDHETAEHASSRGCTIHRRPAELATDSARVVDVVLCASTELDLEPGTVIIVMQPTSPLRTARHIRESLALHRSHEESPVVGVVRCEHHPLKTLTIENSRLIPFADPRYLETSRQNLPVMYRPNGAIYLSTLEKIHAYKSLIPTNSLAYEMTAVDSIDIDEELDLAFAESILQMRSFKI